MRAAAQLRRLLLTLTLVALAGCGSPPLASRADESTGAHWSGRLSLQVEADQEHSFSAAFELAGDGRAGQLSLFGPMGGLLAQLCWEPGAATLSSGSKSTRFDSLETLAGRATGTPLPVTALFAWLAGTPLAAGGWAPDLSGLRAGRLVARRAAPAAELRIVLDR